VSTNTARRTQAACICDGGSYGPQRHPFLVNKRCAVHGPDATGEHRHSWRLGQWGGHANGVTATVQCGYPTPGGGFEHGCGQQRTVRVSANKLAAIAANP
jgi:hypothetical protein